MEKLKFTSNYNNALDLKCFPVIRKENYKYKPGCQFEIVLNNESKGVAEVLQIQAVTIDQLTRSMALLVTGKEPVYLRAILKRMYPQDWRTCKFYYMIFHYVSGPGQRQSVQKETYAYQGTLGITARPNKIHS
jgi:hypothetical protein